MKLPATLQTILRPIASGSICALSFTFFTIYLLRQAGGQVDWISTLAIFGVGGILCLTGHLILNVFGLGDLSSQTPLAFLLGTALLSIVAMTALLVGTRSLVVFEIFSAGVLLLGGLACLRGFRHGTTATTETRVNAIDLVIPSVLFLMAAFWAADLPRALPELLATHRLNAWTDYYIHATELSQLGSAFSSGHGAVLLAGESIPPYHYAYLSVASVLTGFLDIPPLGLATAFLAPFGVFILVCGAYTCGAARSSRTIGILSAVAVLFLPDAAAYGLRNGFWGFHWLVATAPGTGYAVGVALATCALLGEAQRRSRPLLYVLALATMVATAFFRIQVFFLLFPGVIITIAYERESLRKYRRPIALATAGVVALSIVTLVTVSRARAEWLGATHVVDFLRFAHLSQSPTGYSGLAEWINGHTTPLVSVMAGTLFTPVVALGLLIVTWPAVSFLNRYRGALTPLYSLPFFMLFAFIGLILITPVAPSGDSTEFKHRSFPLLYAVFLIWTVVGAGKLCAALLERRSVGMKVAFAAVLSGAIAFRVATYSAPWIPVFDWGKGFYGTTAEGDLVSAALLMRSHRGASDVVAVIPPQAETSLSDRGTIFASLADMPIYLARYPMQKLGGGHHGEVANERMAILKSVDLERHDCESFQMLQRQGVTWLVTYDLPHAPRAQEALKIDRTVVYEVSSAMDAACSAP